MKTPHLLLASVACLVAGAGAAASGCYCLRWTSWINADQNPSDGGDFETIGYNLDSEDGRAGRVTRYLARQGIVCNTPAQVECRDARSGAVWYEVGDDTLFRSRINCDNNRGLVCIDRQQADGRCHDYEIRLLCWMPCQSLAWSRWFDKDDPSGSCDCEHPGWQDHPSRNAPPCENGHSPLEVDCQTLTGTPAAIGPDIKVRCSVGGGFTCVNAEQEDGRCDDYRVRYLCGDPTQ